MYFHNLRGNYYCRFGFILKSWHFCNHHIRSQQISQPKRNNNPDCLIIPITGNQNLNRCVLFGVVFATVFNTLYFLFCLAVCICDAESSRWIWLSATITVKHSCSGQETLGGSGSENKRESTNQDYCQQQRRLMATGEWISVLFVQRRSDLICRFWGEASPTEQQRRLHCLHFLLERGQRELETGGFTAEWIHCTNAE